MVARSVVLRASSDSVPEGGEGCVLMWCGGEVVWVSLSFISIVYVINNRIFCSVSFYRRIGRMVWILQMGFRVWHSKFCYVTGSSRCSWNGITVLIICPLFPLKNWWSITRIVTWDFLVDVGSPFVSISLIIRVIAKMAQLQRQNEAQNSPRWSEKVNKVHWVAWKVAQTPTIAQWYCLRLIHGWLKVRVLLVGQRKCYNGVK